MLQKQVDDQKKALHAIQLTAEQEANRLKDMDNQLRNVNLEKTKAVEEAREVRQQMALLKDNAARQVKENREELQRQFLVSGEISNHTSTYRSKVGTN